MPAGLRLAHRIAACRAGTTGGSEADRQIAIRQATPVIAPGLALALAAALTKRVCAELLLDTNALLWLVADRGRLGREAADRLRDLETRLMVSAASAWEVATKTRSGRLPGDEALVPSWPETLAGL